MRLTVGNRCTAPVVHSTPLVVDALTESVRLSCCASHLPSAERLDLLAYVAQYLEAAHA